MLGSWQQDPQQHMAENLEPMVHLGHLQSWLLALGRAGRVGETPVDRAWTLLGMAFWERLGFGLKRRKGRLRTSSRRCTKFSGYSACQPGGLEGQ